MNRLWTSRIRRALFPLQTRNQQVYWTVVGIPAGRQKSLFDEYGTWSRGRAARWCSRCSATAAVACTPLG